MYRIIRVFWRLPIDRHTVKANVRNIVNKGARLVTRGAALLAEARRMQRRWRRR